ncbi:MAG: N-acetylmuramoyl-L-alanine amidase [Elusimicrobiota bacterium]
MEISAAPIEPLPRAAESVPAAPPAPAAVRAGLRRIRVAVDAGHGGKDGGAPGRRGTLEKDVNLAAARDLANLLEEEKVFDVFLTRRTDEFVPLADRARLANEWKADLFVSLHCNAHRIKSENGFEIYFLSEKASDPEAERLAEFENSVLAMEDKDRVDQDAAGILYALARTEFINEAAELAGRMAQSAAGRVNIANRGVKQAGFYVLRGVNAPAVLVEMGFLSNTEDEAKLGSRKVRRRMVEGLYAGIVDFSRLKLTDGRAH